MSKSQIKEVNAKSGEEIIRDATVDEIKQLEIDVANSEARKAEAQAQATARQALLDKLGITADEAKLLLG